MQIPRLHQSTAKILLEECPAKAAGYTRVQSRGMIQGTVVDQLLFGGDSYVELAYDDYRTKKSQQDRDVAVANGKSPILSKDMARARETVERIQRRLVTEGLDMRGRNARTQTYLEWTSRFGTECAGTPDVFMVDQTSVDTLDLKVGENADPCYLDDHVFSMGWDIQAAAYQEAVHTLNPEAEGRGQHWILCAESKPPYCITLAPLSPAYMAIGLQRWEAAQRIWRRCHETGVWPEYESREIVPSRRVMYKMGQIQ